MIVAYLILPIFSYNMQSSAISIKLVLIIDSHSEIN